MVNLKDQIAQLLDKAEWTDNEKQWLLKYLENTDAKELQDLMQQQFEGERHHIEQVDMEISNKMLQNIHERIGFVKSSNKNKAAIIKMWILKIAAACVIGFLALGAYLWFKNDTGKEVVKTPINNKTYKNEVLPDNNKTVLTLADGSTIVLDDSQNGMLTLQGNTKVIKLNGKLAYNSSNANGNEVFYNTITTPHGEQYQVELPDGSQVWLNTASSIHFPTAFVGKERIVEVTGEAYFEVAPLTRLRRGNGKIPFIVKVLSEAGQDRGTVEVVGTHFNVMAYSDEAALTTTLLEGKVKFINGKTTSTLQPGQQSRLAKNGQVKVISGVDLDEVVAWKKGIFDFEGADIESVTRQLSRWYDVEIVYDKNIDDLFYAKIPRNTPLADVLKALELTGKVRFKIEGKKIIVMP